MGCERLMLERHIVSESDGDRAERLTRVALDLAVIVRDVARDDIAAHVRRINDRDKDALIVVLACLIDIDRPASDLLSWVRWEPDGTVAPRRRRKINVSPRVRQHHAAYNRGQRTPAVVEGERAYQREKARLQRLHRRTAA